MAEQFREEVQFVIMRQSGEFHGLLV